MVRRLGILRTAAAVCARLGMNTDKQPLSRVQSMLVLRVCTGAGILVRGVLRSAAALCARPSQNDRHMILNIRVGKCSTACPCNAQQRRCGGGQC